MGTAVSGFIGHAAQADAIVTDEDAGTVMVARVLLRDANCTRSVAKALDSGESVPWLRPYQRAG